MKIFLELLLFRKKIFMVVADYVEYIKQPISA